MRARVYKLFGLCKPLNGTILLTIILTLAPSISLAWIPMDAGGAPPPRPSDPAKHNIKNFRLDGKRIPLGGQCEIILTEAQQRLGRVLTHAELEQILPRVLLATKETMTLESSPSTKPETFSCFTSRMSVLTPAGERLISDLRPGDEVISVDLETKMPVVNKIKSITTAKRHFSRLIDLDRNIEVTGRHPFYAQSSINDPPGIMPIEEIPEGDMLFKFCGIQHAVNCLTAVSRGRYLPDGFDLVHDLTLIGEPRNFIVEGILVHNKFAI